MSAYRATPVAFFFALFPAFFAYHTLIATGVIPPLLWGGGWTLVNATGVAVLGTMMAYTLLRASGPRRAPEWWMHIAVAMLGLWVAACALYYVRWGVDHQGNSAMFLESVKLLTAWGCLYALGYLLRPTEGFSKAVTLCVAGMIVVTFLVIDPTTLRSPQEGGASYHWFANSIVFSAVVCLSYAPPTYQATVIAGSLSALFLIGSRSEFAGFAAMVAVWAAIAAQRNRASELALAISSGAAAIIATVALSPYLPLISTAPLPSASVQVAEVQGAPQSTITERQMEVADLSKSESFQIRQDFLRRGWAAIKASPLVGDYGGQLRGDGALGHYIHNALSAWRQFGVMPFLIYVALVLAPPIIAGRAVFLRSSTDSMWLLTLYVGLFTLLLVGATKSVFWPLPALAWGLLAQSLSRDTPAVARMD